MQFPNLFTYLGRRFDQGLGGISAGHGSTDFPLRGLAPGIWRFSGLRPFRPDRELFGELSPGLYVELLIGVAEVVLDGLGRDEE